MSLTLEGFETICKQEPTRNITSIGSNVITPKTRRDRLDRGYRCYHGNLIS